MLNGLRNVVVLAAAGAALSGCHTLRAFTQSCPEDRGAYTKAANIPPIRVPVGIDPPDTKSALQLPALNEPAEPTGTKGPCLDEPPRFTDPRAARPPPAA
jgi:uncharacterized lipoprotein